MNVDNGSSPDIKNNLPPSPPQDQATVSSHNGRQLNVGGAPQAAEQQKAKGFGEKIKNLGQNTKEYITNKTLAGSIAKKLTSGGKAVLNKANSLAIMQGRKKTADIPPAPKPSDIGSDEERVQFKTEEERDHIIANLENNQTAHLEGDKGLKVDVTKVNDKSTQLTQKTTTGTSDLQSEVNVLTDENNLYHGDGYTNGPVRDFKEHFEHGEVGIRYYTYQKSGYMPLEPPSDGKKIAHYLSFSDGSRIDNVFIKSGKIHNTENVERRYVNPNANGKDRYEGGNVYKGSINQNGQPSGEGVFILGGKEIKVRCENGKLLNADGDEESKAQIKAQIEMPLEKGKRPIKEIEAGLTFEGWTKDDDDPPVPRNFGTLVDARQTPTVTTIGHFINGKPVGNYLEIIDGHREIKYNGNA